MRSLRPLLILALAGCTSVLPAQKSQDLSPRPVTTSLPIGVFPLLFNLEPGQVVGGEALEVDGYYEKVFAWKDGFRLRRHAFQNPARQELKENGFVFAVGSKASYQLKSTIESMVLNQFPTYSEAAVDVTWKFEGPNGMELRTSGYAKVEGTGNEALYRAYRTSLRNLLARDDILARFAPKGLPPKTVEATPPARDDAVEDLGNGEPDADEPPPDPPRPEAIDRTLAVVEPAIGDLDDDALDRRVRPGVVTLLARDRWSSGIVVSNDGLVITTAHLVAGVGYVNLVLHDGTTRSAKVLLVDKEADLALVKSQSSHSFSALPLREDRPGVGEIVSAYGTPYHSALSVPIARGDVTRDVGARIETRVKVVAGNAGGPIVDRRGNVVGVVTWTRKRTSGKAKAKCIPVDTVLKSLRLSYD